MSLATQRVCEILGLENDPGNDESQRLAAAIEHGLPPHALVRTVARAGLSATARDVLLNSIAPGVVLHHGSRLTPAQSEWTERLARVIACAEILWDEMSAAHAFLIAPHPELEGRTPLECAATERRTRQVEEVVHRALYGLPA